MKTLVALFTITFALFLMSCSNLDQGLSPVGPETSKISSPDAPGTYSYLTTFASIPVESFTILPGGNDIEVVVGDLGWPVDVEHIYVVLQYSSDSHPSADKMVYMEKPRAVTFNVQGFQTSGLKDVKVYCYEPVTDPGVISPFSPLQPFNDVEIQWSANDKEIQILLGDSYVKLGDSFAEINSTEGSFVVYLDNPNSKEILIPKSGKAAITSVRFYSILF